MENLIAQIRDTHVREILLIINDRSKRKDTDLLGLNLRKIAKSEDQNKTFHAWYFARNNYKKAPDWLNSRYWANPEKFDKYRW